ncbi:12732_t:CDS:1, partial [Funneliformis caledonium]
NGDNNIDGDGDNGNGKENKIYVFSRACAKAVDLDIFQDFNISASFWAKTSPFEKEVGILEYDINVIACGIGEMLSNNWPALKRLGIGYFLHSTEVHVSPTPDIMSNLFWLKGISQPTQSNRKVEFSTGSEKVINGQVGTSSCGITGGIKKVHNTKFSSNEWKLSYKGPNIKGESWSYEFVDIDGSNRESFSPGTHSGQWFIMKEMQGFCVTITQVLCCEITHDWRRFIPNTKFQLLKLCPKMCHSLKITFNDLKDFNAKLSKLNQTCYPNTENIMITLGRNEKENINKAANQKIENLNGEIMRMLRF